MFGFKYRAQGKSQRMMVRASALMAGAVLMSMASAWLGSPADAKGPGHTYCFFNTCHRVKTIAETQSLVGQDLTLVASFYDACGRDRYNPCGLTSSGERFRPEAPDNAASPLFPDGTILLVWSPMNREALVVRINNAGPYWADRKLDLSRAAARKLGLGGVGKVRVRVLKAPTKRESIYSAHRSYEAVPGPIGTFATLDAAHSSLATLVAAGAPGSGAIKLALISSFAAQSPAAGLAAALRAEQAMHTADRAATQAPVRIVTAKAIGWPVVYDAPKPAIATPARKHVRTQTAAVKVPLVKPVIKPVRIASAAPAKKAVTVKDDVRRDRVSASSKKARAELAALVKSEVVRPAVARKAIARAASKPAASRTFADKVPPATPTKIAAKVWSKPHVAEVPVHREIKVGFTTYAEKRHQWRKYAAAAKPGAVKAPVAKTGPKPQPAPAPITNATAAKAPVGRAALEKNKKSAVVRKAAGWQTSDLRDRGSVPRPAGLLTGSRPRLPADSLERLAPARPNGIRVRPPALA